MLNIHVVAPFRLLRAASDYLRATAKRETAAGQRVMRKVVNITSISGTEGNPGQAGYSAGKSGVIGLTKTLAKEWGRYNINVNAVGFGLIQTRMTQPLTPEAKIEMAGKEIPIGVQPAMLDSIASRMSARTHRNSRRGSRRCALLLFSAIGLRYRRSADLQRGISFLMRQPGRA